MQRTSLVVAMSLSILGIAGCANAHEGDGDAGPVVHDAGFEILDAAPVHDAGGPSPCGPTFCAPGLSCCNASCGICTPPGTGCVDLACADAGAERVCGGLAGLTCAPSEYCDYPDGSTCGGDDAQGVCRPRPASCPDPGGNLVCGCDDHDYIGECSAYFAGIDVARTGRCHTTTPATQSMSAAESCAPTDGPAWTFTVTGGSTPVCGTTPQPTLRISLWSDLGSASGQTFHVGNIFPSEGSATSCPAGPGAPCIGLAGTVTVHSFAASSSASISYDLSATTGEHVTGSHFAVGAWCPGTPLCG